LSIDNPSHETNPSSVEELLPNPLLQRAAELGVRIRRTALICGHLLGCAPPLFSDAKDVDVQSTVMSLLGAAVTIFDCSL
jgi:hypothetical protein